MITPTKVNGFMTFFLLVIEVKAINMPHAKNVFPERFLLN